MGDGQIVKSTLSQSVVLVSFKMTLAFMDQMSNCEC